MGYPKIPFFCIKNLYIRLYRLDQSKPFESNDLTTHLFCLVKPGASVEPIICGVAAMPRTNLSSKLGLI